MVVSTTPQSFSIDSWGDGVVVPPDPHFLVGRLKVRDELKHCVLRSCNGWMARQYVEIMVLDNLADHRVAHLVLRGTLLPM